jgi:DNA-binding NtrC family response regulator
VVRCDVPPLRERPATSPTLARHFAESHGPLARCRCRRSLLVDLARHDWPGNVRELRNVVERALSLGALGVDDELGGHRAAPAATATAAPASHEAILELPFKEAKAALVEGFERDYLVHLLARHKGNISRAALEAGIDRNYIHRLVKKYGLDVERG